MGKGDLVPRIITHFGVAYRCGPGEGFVSAGPVNLSETGLCLRLKRPLEAGQEIELQVRLGQKSEEMQVPGRVVWLRQVYIKNVYYCGVGFTRISKELLEQIKDYVEIGGASLLGFFSEFPVFADFSPEDCRALLRIITLRELEPKEVLYIEGTHDADLQGLFIVQSGLLNIFKGRTPSPNRQLAVVSAGQIFGEATLINNQPHSASVMAVNTSRLIQINKMGFKLLREKEPKLALKIMDLTARSLASRLVRTTKKLFSPANY
jgi:Tfp pilus assembly protein PilZ